MNRFKDIINAEMNNIQLSDDIKMNILNSKYTYKKKRFNIKPLVVALTTICTVSILTVGVGAVAFGGFNEFINGVNILFEPINETCIDNDIKITVIFAGVDDIKNKTMSAYVTVEDTTNQHRINKDTNLSAWIKEENNQSGDEHATMDCQMISFDNTTNVATYKIVSTIDWWHDFTNKNTLYLNGLVNENTVTKVIEGVDLYNLAKNSLDKGFTYYNINCGSKNGFYGCYKTSSVPTQYKSIVENLDNVWINDNTQLTAIGFIDGHLHIKLRYTYNNYDASTYESIQKIKLIDSNGKDILNTGEFKSSITIHNFDNYEYDTYDENIQIQDTEICFPKIKDISQLEGLKISYDVDTWTIIEGEWNITFKVNDTTPNE